MKGSKGQPTIASFFGKPKSTPALVPPAAGGKGGEGAKPQPSSTDVLKEANNSVRSPARVSGAGEQTHPAVADDAGKSKMKRLRKSSPDTAAKEAAVAADAPAAAQDAAAQDAAVQDEPAASGAAQPSTSAAGASGSEEEEGPAVAAPRRAKKRRVMADSDSSPEVKPARRRKSPPKVAAADASAAAAACAADADSDVEVGEEDGGDRDTLAEAEGEEVRAKKVPILKAAKAKGVAKMEGVGTLALAAAQAHANFDAASVATWAAGEPVPFTFLVATWEAIAEEPKRLQITNLLINAFRAILATTPGDLLPAVYLCTDRVAPPHEGVELGIGDATLIKALAASTGRSEALIKKEYGEVGDLGIVAASARTAQKTMFKPKPLTVQSVFKTFKEIASTEGKASTERKKALIGKLLVASKQQEAGYIMRALQGKLRIGLADQTVLVALAHAVTLQRDGGGNGDGALANRLEGAAQAVKQAFSECPSFDDLVPALLQHGAQDLPAHVHFTPGIPVRPMLAKPTTGCGEVLDKFSGVPFTCEYKYDGERAQVHVLDDGSVKIYSRNAEDTTPRFPDIAAAIPTVLAPGTRSIVFDAEAVAYDKAEGRILPFQVLSTRGRKDVKVSDIKVQVCLFAFDCLYLNGDALLRRPLTERRDALYGALREVPGQFEFAKYKSSSDVEELQQFLDDAVAHCTEGLIVKTMDATYEPSRRSTNWLKLKKDYLEGCGDTFDVVPLGAWHGRGKRAGLYGAFLLGVYDSEAEEFQTISKIGTGFSDEALKSLSEALQQHVLPAPKPYYRYGETLVPDVWFEAKVVWEVKAADLSISPVHQAAHGLVDPTKGISIRFPRLVRVRDDKAPEDATSAEQVAEMYRSQAATQKGKPKAAPADDF